MVAFIVPGSQLFMPFMMVDLRERFDRVRRDPDCADCRAALASSLWQRIAPPPQGPRSRAGLDAAGEAWLRALEAAR